uniref:Transmembrane protein 33 n=2 Tax=Caenorhabditis tropicalis TaxID=1561998 RepID=A0A1I7UPG3_9PELO
MMICLALLLSAFVACGAQEAPASGGAASAVQAPNPKDCQTVKTLLKMVEIVEETDDHQSSSSGAGTSGSSSNSTPRPAYSSISHYVSANTMECVLFATRVLTVFFAINYMIPYISFVSPHSAYYKIFAASAATFSLRLHTRIQGQIAPNAAFIQRLVTEDSFHYLVYSVVFLMAAPVSMAALPVTIYAALHACTFLTKILRETGHNLAFVPKLEAFTVHQTPNALGIIACSEIFLIPLLVSLIFSGKGSMLLPFAYYRFLSLRYASRRNPSTRQAFAQMRGSLQNVAQSPSCPAIISSFIYRAIDFISARAPPVM